MLTRIQQYLRAVAPTGRECEQVGPFLATFDPYSDHPYFNYALPDDGAEPTDAEVTGLVAAYRAGTASLDSSTSMTVPRLSSKRCSPGGSRSRAA